jgi:hypothetical protein
MRNIIIVDVDHAIATAMVGRGAKCALCRAVIPIGPDIVTRQQMTFADWCAEVRELADEQWPEVSDQCPTLYAVWGGGATPHQALHMIGLILPPRQYEEGVKPWTSSKNAHRRMVRDRHVVRGHDCLVHNREGLNLLPQRLGGS